MEKELKLRSKAIRQMAAGQLAFGIIGNVTVSSIQYATGNNPYQLVQKHRIELYDELNKKR